MEVIWKVTMITLRQLMLVGYSVRGDQSIHRDVCDQEDLGQKSESDVLGGIKCKSRSLTTLMTAFPECAGASQGV